MNRRDVVRLLAAVPATHVLDYAFAHARKPRFVERWSWAMGQPVHIQAWVRDEDRGLEAIAAALHELRDVESQLSLFDDASDLSELNRRAGGGAVRAGHHLRAALAVALRVHNRTQGAFDPAVEPLLRAWGFRTPRAAPPDAAALAEARAAVRAAAVTVDAAGVTLAGSMSRLDLGGIGVGYGLDRMGEVLRAHGVGSALLDVSGDLLAIGAPPGEPGWRVALAEPDGTRLESRPTVTLRDRALATSANTVETVRYGALVVGHVLDPHDGDEAHALRQAAVVARTAVMADALSTAALVGGRDVVRGEGRMVGAWRHT